jgi:type I restriction enzyme R subunit
MRPVFSPTDFIQIKGRGTRKHNFGQELHDRQSLAGLGPVIKDRFKLFDFFANCEYFEEKFDYDEVLKLPARGSARSSIASNSQSSVHEEIGSYENFGPDALRISTEIAVGLQGMKIDRMFFERFEDIVRNDPVVKKGVEDEMWDRVMEYIRENLLNKPEDYFTLDKLRQAAGVDRRLSLREIIEKAYGFIPRFKSKDELLEEEFAKFLSQEKPTRPASILPMKYYFKAYLTDSRVRGIIDSKRFIELNTNPTFTLQDFKAVPEEMRARIPEYIKDYISLNTFAA